MPETDPSPPSQAAKRQNDYPIGGSAATHSLKSCLLETISLNGPLRFPDFMETALYHPALGYYARGTRQIGREGDFFTSVSVGPLFGELLARRFLQEWREIGKPAAWRIIESGAHDGTLAADVLGAIAILEPPAFEALEYAIPEPLAALQAAQRATLASFGPRVRWLGDAKDLAANPLPGIAFGNELLDALPFHIVERRDGDWLEVSVTSGNDGALQWHAEEIQDPTLRAALAPLGSAFPDGYRTEVRTGIAAFLQPLVHGLESGLMLWADYGFARPDYYHPARNTGTLRTFSKHRAGEDPLAYPGEFDITAHVDFTSVAETATALGGHAIGFHNQGAWLTGLAREWLVAQEGNPRPDLLKQFQTLTHPAHLGSRFHILELSWRASAKACDPDALKHRLFP